MTRIRMTSAAVLAVTLIAMTGLLVAAQASPDVLLRAAIERETIHGDVKGAIAAYAKLADQGDRVVAAQALLRLGDAQRKLGDGRAATAAYERVARDFGDQPSALAAARARVPSRAGAIAGDGSQVSYVPVWSGPKVDFTGSVSSDGRYISYVDWVGQGNVAIRDLATNTDRHVTKGGSLGTTNNGFAENSVISRDGSQIAYSWHRGPGIGIRVMSLQASDGAARDLHENPEVQEAYPLDWSPDGRFLAVQMRRGDSTVIGLMSVADGSVRQLKSSDWTRRASSLALSPDGRFMAFDLGNDDGRTRHVSILAVDGTQPQQDVVAHASLNTVVGWAPDGTHLLFMSDRRGTPDLWSLPVRDGRARGEARLLKSNAGTTVIGMTRTGALYVGVSLSQRDITVAAVDMTTGARLSAPTKPIATYVGTNVNPDWSADGKRLAYISQRPLLRLLGILDVETGRTREFALPTMTYFQLPSWAPDGRSLAVQGTDQQGRQGIFRIDAESGTVGPIALSERGGVMQAPRWSPDGKSIHYRSGGLLVVRDLASGSARRLRSGCGPDPERYYGRPSVSPDGRFVATYCDGGASESSVVVVPVDGDIVRELGRLPVDSVRQVTWTADGMSVVVMKRVKPLDTTTAEAELWAYPVDGSAPRKLDVPLSHADIWSPVRVHPDGRQIAYVEGENAREVWKLENVLP